MKKLLLAVVWLITFSGWAAPCYDLTKGEPRSLNGKLSYVVFPGPPNFTDVKKGDTPEPTYILELVTPICLKGDEDFADPKIHFNTVHLRYGKEASAQLKASVNKKITVNLSDPYAAHTGHHHAPLVASVVSVQLEGEKPSTTRTLEFVEEYGTPATTIRAFYKALQDGQGEIASLFVVPEKRTTPAFLGANLTKFYGSLAKPIQLIDIAEAGSNTYTVRYAFATNSKVCDGLATVITTVREGQNLILSIKAHNGC